MAKNNKGRKFDPIDRDITEKGTYSIRDGKISKRNNIFYFAIFLALFLVVADVFLLGNSVTGFVVAPEQKGPTGLLGAPVCGDNVIDQGETCDGTDLNSKDCTNYIQNSVFDGGTLACNDGCSAFDTNDCCKKTCEQENANLGCYGTNKLFCKKTETNPCLHPVAVPCGSDEVCKEENGEGVCKEKEATTTVISLICTEGELKCVGQNVYTCNQKNTGWDIKEKCDYRCENGECIAKVCDDGEQRCSGLLHQICSDNRWTTIKACSYRCDPETFICIEAECTDSDEGSFPETRGITRGIDLNGEFCDVNSDYYLEYGICEKGVFVEKKDECGAINLDGNLIPCECDTGEDCITPCNLEEFYCVGTSMRTDTISCEYGCKNGACISPENVLVRLVKSIIKQSKMFYHGIYRALGISINCVYSTDCIEEIEYCDDTTFTCELKCGNGVIDEGEVCDIGIKNIIEANLDRKNCTNPEFTDEEGNPFTGGTLKCLPNCLNYDVSGCAVAGETGETCSQQGGDICSSDEKCLAGTFMISTDSPKGLCCVGGVGCYKEEVIEKSAGKIKIRIGE